MTECNYYEVPCTRNLQTGNFAQGVQDFVFSVGAPNCWVPSKSYFRVEMTLTASNPANTPLFPSSLTAFADNAVGNLYDNVYARAGQQDISSIVQYSAQASALKVRLNNTLPWLKSMGSSTAINEASFLKRLQQISANPGEKVRNVPQLTRMDQNVYNEIYKPTADGKFGTATVQVQAAAAGAYSEIHGVDTLFNTGMPGLGVAPNALTAPSKTGGSVNPGDIIVIDGVEFEILLAGAGGTAETVITSTTAAGALFPANPTVDWYIIRADPIRAKQAATTQYSIWQPPIGLFSYSEELGAGDYRIQLNPSSNFNLNAVETRSQDWKTVPQYSLQINDVRLYTYVEKRHIPDTVRDLYLNEMLIQSKPYNSNLQFSVPPSTMAITVFLQDNEAGSNPLIPPSMFKCQDNSDLALQNIQITYANVSKPSTNWTSNYAVSASDGAGGFVAGSYGINELEQRYHDSYEESGLEVMLCGNETFYDYLQRGPFYHYSFERDVNNKSTEVQITSVYKNNFGIPLTNARMFIVAHFRKTVQITTSNGLIVNVSSREV